MTPLVPLDFEPSEVLGEGGAAVVYRARDPDLAIKVPRTELLGTDVTRRFLREGALLARVDHPNVVRVLETGILADGRPYLAMPLLRGETLAQRLARGPLSLGEALATFASIADGVAALHEAGLLHRDLKPENVMLCAADYGSARPVIIDLGIAKDADHAGGPVTTTEGMVRGTRATMAPERLFGAPATVASDVYELALLLYVMTVGALPWGDDGDVEARLTGRAPSESSVPEALSDAIMMALSTRTERRPNTVRALAANVARATESTSVRASEGGRHTDEVPARTSASPDVRASAPARPARFRAAPILGGVALAGAAAIMATFGLGQRRVVAVSGAASASVATLPSSRSSIEPPPSASVVELPSTVVSTSASTTSASSTAARVPLPIEDPAFAPCRAALRIQCDPTLTPEARPFGSVSCPDARANMKRFEERVSEQVSRGRYCAEMIENIPTPEQLRALPQVAPSCLALRKMECASENGRAQPSVGKPYTCTSLVLMLQSFAKAPTLYNEATDLSCRKQLDADGTVPRDAAVHD